MDKEKKILEIITFMNNAHRQGENVYFECWDGSIPIILHLFWGRQRWEYEWVKLQTDPTIGRA